MKQNKVDIIISFTFLAIAICLVILVYNQRNDNYSTQKKYIKVMEENKKLEKENKRLGEWNLECHDYWEDRYNMRSEKDYEELLIYVDYYVRQKNIIEGMFNDKNLIQNVESWQISYGCLYENYCFGCGSHEKRHQFLLKEVETQPCCNNCY